MGRGAYTLVGLEKTHESCCCRQNHEEHEKKAEAFTQVRGETRL